MSLPVPRSLDRMLSDPLSLYSLTLPLLATYVKDFNTQLRKGPLEGLLLLILLKGALLYNELEKWTCALISPHGLDRV